MATLLQGAAEALGLQPTLPKEVSDKTRKGRDRLRRVSSLNNECWRFWRNDQYVYVDSKGFLQSLPTVSGAQSGLPPHKVRTTRNLIFDHVEHEVSAATQRVPSYDVVPSSQDPKRMDAAQLSEKVALYGHERWDIPLSVEKVVRSAIVTHTGEGFAWPYFDNTRGKPIPQAGVATGEVCIRTFGPNEVFWEPGVRFEDSRWHVVEQARSLDDVYGMDGYLGGKLKADANTADLWTDKKRQSQDNLVVVSDYLERPSPKHPQGRWFTSANKRLIVAERPYPLTDAKGQPVDEPVLVKLHYALDADSDRDRGLVPYLLDPQRTVNDCENKALEAKNLGLVPQGVVQMGVWPEGQKRTDEPGALYKIAGDPNTAFKWLDPPSPQLFINIQNIGDRARADMGRIAAQNDIPSQIDSGKGAEVIIERDQTRKANFLANLARFYSKLMHRCLVLVQQHYSDERLLVIEGAFGFESIGGFKGSDLMGELDVRVLPSSIEPLTRESLEQKLTFYAQMGWIAPEKAIASIQAGTGATIVQSYELQIRAEQREIQRMTALAGTLSVVSTPEDFAQAGVPIPKPWENQNLRMSVLADFFATPGFESLPPQVQQVMEQHYYAHKQLGEEQMMQQAQQATVMAQALGTGNAARPTQPGANGGTPMPSPPQQPKGSPPTPVGA